MTDVKKFQVDISKLSSANKKVLEIMDEIGNLVHEIWLKQVDPKEGCDTCYPDGVTEETLRKAAKTDLSIASPYTVVKKKDENSFDTVHYREAYREEIDQIVEKLKKAAEITEEEEFQQYLLKTAESFDEGDFDESLEAYVQNGNTTIDFFMGPIETFEDKKMGWKKTFQFNLRVIRPEETYRSEEFVDLFKKADVLNPVSNATKVMEEHSVRLRVDDVVKFGGRQAGTSPLATNMPDDEEQLERLGTKVVLYKNSLREKYDEFLGRKGNDFHPEHDFSREDIYDGLRNLIAFHEISESLIKFENAPQRLGRMHDAIRELNATLLGLKSMQYNVLKGLFSKKEMMNTFYGTFVYLVDLAHKYKDNPSYLEYARGWALILTYAKRLGIIEYDDEWFEIKADKQSELLTILGSIVLQVYEYGDEEDAVKMFEEYGDFDVLDAIVDKKYRFIYELE
jgi:hypothetical protein